MKKHILTCVILILSMCSYAVLAGAADSISTSYDYSTHSLKVSGSIGSKAYAGVGLTIGAESDVTSDGVVLAKPFSDDSKPQFSYVTATGGGGVFSEEIKLPASLTSDSYYVFATSGTTEIYDKVIIYTVDDVNDILSKFNDSSLSVSQLEAYLKTDRKIENIGYVYEKVEKYIGIICSHASANRPSSGYTYDTLTSAINLCIASQKLEDNESVDSVMREYSSVFGCEYAQWTSLDEDIRSEIADILASTDLLSDGAADFDELVALAKLRIAADSGIWAQLRAAVEENAAALGISLSGSYLYLSDTEKPQVFQKLITPMKTVTSASDAAAQFGSAVSAVASSSSSQSSSPISSSKHSSSGVVGGSPVSAESSVSAPSYGNYSDIQSHFCRDAVVNLSALGIINGYPDSTFRPDASVTRAEFSKMIASAFGFTADSGTTFDDVSSFDWYYDCINALSSKAILLGDGRMFRPNEQITRQDAAVVVARALRFLGKSYNGAAEFSDSAQISDYALDDIASMSAAGVIVGSNNCFYPTNAITRGEAAVMIERAYNIVKGA